MSRDVVRAVACPYCGAKRGEPCRAMSLLPTTRRTHYTHAARARHFEETAYLRAELRLTDGDLYVAAQEVRRLREAVERVRQIHALRPADAEDPDDSCEECLQDYPCSTIRALDGAE